MVLSFPTHASIWKHGRRSTENFMRTQMKCRIAVSFVDREMTILSMQSLPTCHGQKESSAQCTKKLYTAPFAGKILISLHLTKGAEELLQYMKEHDCPYILASASIQANIDFYFETFHLERWLNKETCVYDDGTYDNKGEMHLEATRRLGADISECIVVEDSLNAIKHARNNKAGMIVAIGSENTYPDLIRAGADHCIKDFTEFDYEWLRN
ncbi:MAG: HAD family hydrolase [Roseburia inulinivorans]